MSPESIHEIKKILYKCIDGAINRTSKNRTYRPFHEALLSKEIISFSSFERSFSTSFGQGPIEEISYLVAKVNGYKVVRQKELYINVFKGAIDEIERNLSSLRSGEKKPNWKQEVKKIVTFSKGDTEVRRIISDLWLEKNGQETFISIKTVKPNLDQTEIAKKTMLLLKAHQPKFETYFGLFYNPGGEKREDYNWSIPSKIFDMLNDECVLIGQDYWDKIGGFGTYQTLLEIFKDVGIEIQQKIKNL